MAAHMDAETMAVEKAPLIEKTKRRAACHLENRTQREQTNESMCECAMGEVRWANAVHQKLDHWTQAFIAQAPGHGPARPSLSLLISTVVHSYTHIHISYT